VRPESCGPQLLRLVWLLGLGDQHDLIEVDERGLLTSSSRSRGHPEEQIADPLCDLGRHHPASDSVSLLVGWRDRHQTGGLSLDVDTLMARPRKRAITAAR